MNNVDKQYLDLMRHVLENGVTKKDRTGVGTRSVFGTTLRFKMSEGFPLLTTKKIHTKSVVTELLWFLQGGDNIKYLVDNGVSIWNEWPHQTYTKYRQSVKNKLDAAMAKADIHDGNIASEVSVLNKWLQENPELTVKEFAQRIKDDNKFAEDWGKLGPVYGKQWRNWVGKVGQFDQIAKIMDDLKNNPDSRRIMVNAWNVAEIDMMKLPPCHYGFQLWTRELAYEERKKLVDVSDRVYPTMEKMDEMGIQKRALSLMFQMRSVDVLLGMPFDIASYGCLLHMIAQCANMVPDELIGNFADTHIYLNHFDAVNEQLSREPMELCTLKLKKPEAEPGILNYKLEDFEFVNYQSHPAIKAPIAV